MSTVPIDVAGFLKFDGSDVVPKLNERPALRDPKLPVARQKCGHVEQTSTHAICLDFRSTDVGADARLTLFAGLRRESDDPGPRADILACAELFADAAGHLIIGKLGHR